MKIIFRIHAIERMFERGIGISEIRTVLEKGETIEHYVDEATYPGRLITTTGGGKRPLHVVAADNLADGEVIIVTGYRPDRRRWMDDFKRRRDEVPDL